MTDDPTGNDLDAFGPNIPYWYARLTLPLRLDWRREVAAVALTFVAGVAAGALLVLALTAR